MLTAVRRNRTMGVANRRRNYLTFTALEEATLGLYIYSNVTTQYVEYVEYSLDWGKTWTRIVNVDNQNVNMQFPTLQAGESIQLRGKALAYTVEGGINNTSSFTINQRVQASGNIMSMLNPEFENIQIVPQLAFAHLFEGCVGLVTPPELPASVLGGSCYAFMFRGCTNLTTAPELPSINLGNGCYGSMFMECTSLTQAPVLPAKNLGTFCYSNMFCGCTSITTAPSLPATTLPQGCYQRMFKGCTNLINAPELPATDLTITGSVYNGVYEEMFIGCTSLINAPALPATALSSYCYAMMFRDCTSLITAPELPATILKAYCYKEMFRGCASLNKITMLGETLATQSLYNWVNGVAANGTFIKSPNMTTLPSGTSGIPNGWTVQDYQN